MAFSQYLNCTYRQKNSLTCRKWSCCWDFSSSQAIIFSIMDCTAANIVLSWHKDKTLVILASNNECITGNTLGNTTEASAKYSYKIRTSDSWVVYLTKGAVHILLKHFFDQPPTFTRIFWAIVFFSSVLKISNYIMNILSKCNVEK